MTELTTPLDRRDLQQWTGREYLALLVVGLLVAILGVGIYAAVQAHRANEYAQIATNNTVSSSDFSGSTADSAVQDVCTLLGAVAKQQGVKISSLFGTEVTDCATAAIAAKP